jgi:ankyrin repeat protein
VWFSIHIFVFAAGLLSPFPRGPTSWPQAGFLSRSEGTTFPYSQLSQEILISIPTFPNDFYHLPLFAEYLSVRQVTQGVGHRCHESIDDANYDGDRGRTPLSRTAMRGHVAVLESLLKISDVNLNYLRDPCGATPLSWAAEFGYEAVVKLLLARDDVNPNQISNGRTPLMFAAERGHDVVVKLLLAENGVKPDYRDGNG